MAYGNELTSGVAPATQEVLGLMHSWTPGAPQYQRFVGLLLQALPPGYELEQVPKPPGERAATTITLAIMACVGLIKGLGSLSSW